MAQNISNISEVKYTYIILRTIEYSSIVEMYMLQVYKLSSDINLTTLPQFLFYITLLCPSNTINSLVYFLGFVYEMTFMQGFFYVGNKMLYLPSLSQRFLTYEVYVTGLVKLLTI